MVRFDHDFVFETNQAQEAIISSALSLLHDERNSGKVGYYTLPQDSMKLLDSIDIAKYEKMGIRDIAVIGIGGSSLGAKALNSALKDIKEPKKALHFFENSDPVTIAKTLKNLKKETTLFVVISKSGSTIETISIFKTVIAHFELDLKGEDKNRIITITDEGSSLDKFSRHYEITSFYIPHNVGGRFSVLSAVGVVPLALAGYDVRALLEGAGKFSHRFFSRQEDHLLHKAGYYYQNNLQAPINVLFTYADSLEDFTKWYVQLWGESLGKIDMFESNVGFTPIGVIGAVDQHSFLQLLIDGPKDKSVTFIVVEDFGQDLSVGNVTLPHIESTDFINGKRFNELIVAQADATRQSLMQNGISTDTIYLERIDEAHLGALIMYYELFTSLMGAMLMINTYDQPGVELGKKILYKKFNAQ